MHTDLECINKLYYISSSSKINYKLITLESTRQHFGAVMCTYGTFVHLVQFFVTVEWEDNMCPHALNSATILKLMVNFFFIKKAKVYHGKQVLWVHDRPSPFCVKRNFDIPKTKHWNH